MPAKRGKAFEIPLIKFHLSSSSSSSSAKTEGTLVWKLYWSFESCWKLCLRNLTAQAIWEQRAKSKMPPGAKLDVKDFQVKSKYEKRGVDKHACRIIRLLYGFVSDSAVALRGSAQPSQYLTDSKKITTNTETAMLSIAHLLSIWTAYYLCS